MDEWIGALTDGRRVKYTYKEVSAEVASITAQAEGDPIIHMQNNVKAPMTHAQVEAAFQNELYWSKMSRAE